MKSGKGSREATDERLQPGLNIKITDQSVTLTHTTIVPEKIANDLEEPPRVLFQQIMRCGSCSYIHTIHQGVSLEKIKDEWVPKRRQDFYPQNICGLCHRGLELVGEPRILWPHLFPEDQREAREKKLRGVGRSRPFILGEDRKWIYWSDGFHMAQHSMISRSSSEEWWKHYFSMTKEGHLQQPVVAM
jgi:hypothetical protein